MTDVFQAVALPYVRLIAEQFGRMDLPLTEWLASSGLRPADLEDPAFVLDVGRFRTLARDARRLSGDPAFGLRIGERLGLQAHGALGYAAMNSRTLREVLDLTRRFLGGRIAVVSMSVEPAGERVRVRLHETLPLGDVRGLVLEGVVSSVKGFLEDVSTGTCDVQSVAFRFPDPGHAAEAEAVLQCPVRYDRDWTGMTLPTRVLDLPLKTSDPRALRQAETMCQRELDALQGSRTWATKVRRVLLDSRVGFPGLEETARRLGVTPRTLRRRLDDEGTAFRAILEDLRHRIAADQLAEGDATIAEIAYILGYGDPANFRRAFRRWTGLSPGRFRRTRRSID